MKSFLHKMNPVSDRAKTDISIMKQSWSSESQSRKELLDDVRHPEINQVAQVRRGLDLCPDEAAFVAARQRHVRDRFAAFIGEDPATVHPDDVPTVAFGGSGGGYRAMLAMLGYSSEMKKSGLWDLLTYTAGVSGACWSLAAYYTFGHYDMDEVIEHCKRRLSPHHPLSDDAIRAVLAAPKGVDVAFGPLSVKSHSGLHVVAMDYYSVFTSGHIFLHSREQRPPNSKDPGFDGFKPEWFKWSGCRAALQDGAEPMPILTAVRHERPWKDWADAEHPFHEANHSAKEHAEDQDAWFQWYEMTPFEVGCDEIEAWVPTWGFGRPFAHGRSTMQLPEHSLALLLGLCTSAPAGPLTSYLATIKRNLPTGFIGDQINHLAKKVASLWGKEGTDIFEGHHPLHACNEHNFLFHYTPTSPSAPRPPGLENSPRIHLIDSGMDNNCPTYVLLHPGRAVDLLINMDASSDVEKDQQARIDQIGGRRGIKFSKRHHLPPPADPHDPDRFRGFYAQIYDGALAPRTPTVIDSYGREVDTPPAPTVTTAANMVYMPLLANERAVPHFNPANSKFSSSYNLIWTPEQVETLMRVCAGNYAQGEPTLRQALREAWERKRAARDGRVWTPPPGTGEPPAPAAATSGAGAGQGPFATVGAGSDSSAGGTAAVTATTATTATAPTPERIATRPAGEEARLREVAGRAVADGQ